MRKLYLYVDAYINQRYFKRSFLSICLFPTILLEVRNCVLFIFKYLESGLVQAT